MWNCKKEMVPLSAMVAIEFINVALNTLFKAAAVKGLNYFVLIVYSHAIGALFLLPFIFLLKRAGLPSIMNSSILYRFVLLAVLGYSASVFIYKGIEYTSPTILSTIGNLTPVFTFIFAVAFRMETLDFKSRRTIAKTIGTVVSISGALITILYKGPVILSSSQPSSSLRASATNWVIGGFLLVALCPIGSMCFIIQTQIVKLYPNEITVAVVSSIMTSIIAAVVGAIMVNDGTAWKLQTDLALITVVVTGIFGPALATAVHTWGLNMKGPVYVTIFKPFSITVAAFLGVVFLHDALYLGSMIGATIILIGFYAVIWGKADEEDNKTLSDEKTSLLL